MAENIQLPASAGNKKVDTFVRTEGADEVHMQAMVPVDPLSGNSIIKQEDSPSASGDAGIVILAKRHDADTGDVGTDGDYSTLKTDENGRLKVTTSLGSHTKIKSITSTNATIIKASAGRIYGWSLTNTSATYKYVKLYNLATLPVPGVTLVLDIIAIPPNDNVSFNVGTGMYFSLGIGLAITDGPDDTDTTAVAANNVIGTLLFA